MMNKSDIGFLLNYCSNHADVYNQVSTHLYDKFGIVGAEIVLLMTYYVCEERRKK